MLAITASGVSKAFRTLTIPKHLTLKELIVTRQFMRRGTPQDVQALQDVSFKLEHGQSLGVIGRNGSGKTTLMRLLAGVFPPDTGSILIDGNIAPLLGLGVGFHPDLSGRENVRIDALLLGLTPREIDQKMESIIAFAEIADFIDAPVRTYSSGMIMRLAFSVAISVDPDVLLLDEVLAVGDEAFARKCLTCMEDFRSRGKTMVLVTHDSNAIETWCDRALWLDKGRVQMFGQPSHVVQAYHAASLAPRAELA